MLMLKLQRRGKIHQAHFRLVVGEKRTKLNGKQLEELGWFIPKGEKSSFDKDRILYWLSQGARMTPTVNNLLVKSGVVKGKKIAVHKVSKKEETKVAPAEVKDVAAPKA